MIYQRKNRAIFINQEAYGTLSLIQNGMLNKFRSLMNEQEAKLTCDEGYFMGEPLPFAFVFAPAGKRNQEIIKSAKKGEMIELVKDDQIVGELICQSVFKFDYNQPSSTIFGASEISFKSSQQIGKYAISGEFKIFDDTIKEALETIERIKSEQNVKKITALMCTADPFHRVHERLIRMAIDKADLVLIFLIRSSASDRLDFNIRKKTLQYCADKFLTKNRIVIIPFENTYIFSGHINPVLECIVAHKFGANKLVVGQNHGAIGMFYNQNQAHTILDKHRKSLDLEILVMPEYVFCNECNSIVSTKTCPHGQHHHIQYHTSTLKALLYEGIMPPAILMRKEVSAMILSELFPQRAKNLQKLYDYLFPNSGILETHSDEEFYIELMNLYQTMSMK